MFSAIFSCFPKEVQCTLLELATHLSQGKIQKIQCFLRIQIEKKRLLLRSFGCLA